MLGRVSRLDSLISIGLLPLSFIGGARGGGFGVARLVQPR
jgi:hypothetical protein